MNGYFKIHRKLLEHPMWLDAPFSPAQAWIDLIGRAAFSDHQVGGTVWKRGEIRCSIASLETRWKWSRQKVRTFLNRLVTDSRVTLNATNKATIITIVNYEDYQGEQPMEKPASNQPATNEQPTSNHNIRRKEGKKVRKQPLPVVIPDCLNTTKFLDAWESFKQHRKELRKTFTALAQKKALKVLAQAGEISAVEAIEKSIQSGWTGVYPENGRRPNKTTGSGMSDGELEALSELAEQGGELF